MRLIQLVAVCLSLAFLSACGINENRRQANPSGSSSRKLVVASEATFPPMEFKDEAGKIVGFDVDLVHAIAKEAGLEVEFQDVAWDGIFGALKSGSADIIASSVTITDERKAQFDFSDPYLEAGQVLVVRAQDREKYPDLAALQGKKIGVQMGTTAAEYMERQTTGSYTLGQYNTAGLAIIDLANGNVDGAVIDKPVADYYATQKPEFAQKLHVAAQPETKEQFGLVVQKGNEELLRKLNEGLAKIKADGTFGQIQAKWFR